MGQWPVCLAGGRALIAHLIGDQLRKQECNVISTAFLFKCRSAALQGYSGLRKGQEPS